MKKKYTIEIKEFEDDSGDGYIEIPQALMGGLDWQEGDSLKFLQQKDGSFIIKKNTNE